MTTVNEARMISRGPWPALPLREWQDTYATLHRWTQIVGKTRLGLAPTQNHWRGARALAWALSLSYSKD